MSRNKLEYISFRLHKVTDEVSQTKIKDIKLLIHGFCTCKLNCCNKPFLLCIIVGVSQKKQISKTFFLEFFGKKLSFLTTPSLKKFKAKLLYLEVH